MPEDGITSLEKLKGPTLGKPYFTVLNMGYQLCGSITKEIQKNRHKAYHYCS
jgi:hypothetical protein